MPQVVEGKMLILTRKRSSAIKSCTLTTGISLDGVSATVAFLSLLPPRLLLLRVASHAGVLSVEAEVSPHQASCPAKDSPI